MKEKAKPNKTKFVGFTLFCGPDGCSPQNANRFIINLLLNIFSSLLPKS
jgi:hypothetical protein